MVFDALMNTVVFEALMNIVVFNDLFNTVIFDALMDTMVFDALIYTIDFLFVIKWCIRTDQVLQIRQISQIRYPWYVGLKFPFEESFDGCNIG